MLMWVAQVHRRTAQRLEPTGRLKCILLCVAALNGLPHVSAHAIDVHLTAQQIQTALDQGIDAAKKGMSPDSFYVRFGVADEVQSKGVLITKIGALSVMATHMALRGLQPSEADVQQVLEGRTMLVSTVIFGNRPDFAVDSYMILNQGGKTIKPVMVRFDARADRSVVWPESPRFKAKVIASFDYADFNPKAKTAITVYQGSGGESSFTVDFLQIH